VDGLTGSDPRLAVTRSRLAADLRRLGVRAGGITMVHTRMSALGWVVGGSETVVRALLDALGPEGTLAAYASWEEHVYQASDWPREHRDAYLEEPPVFDVATAEAARDHGRIPERVRTWPGAQRSSHPEASVVAVGARATWLTDTHLQDDGYGRDSPFGRLVDAGGQVLLLGAPLETVTLLHHAEAIARAPHKRRVTFRIPVARAGGVVERTYTDIETSEGAFAYDELGLDDDPFAVIAAAALAAGIGVSCRVGQAESHLFPALELTAFAVAWMEERFGEAEG
jgi:aminoglycoside 3-N-acetyltransferase